MPYRTIIDDYTLVDWYLDVLRKYKDKLLGITRYVVADAWFSKAMKRNIKIVFHYPKSGGHKIYFSTDLDMSRHNRILPYTIPY